VGQLTGGVAHNFNNLLSATMSNSELLELNLGGNDELRQLAREIVKASRRGADLTHRLLAFSRQQTLQPRTIQLDDLCEGMSELLKRSLGETYNVKIAVRGKPWSVLADPGQVESALLNLAINASHAMPSGGNLGFLIENSPVTDYEWAQRW
jgi:signal transduction histidine kinase